MRSGSTIRIALEAGAGLAVLMCAQIAAPVGASLFGNEGLAAQAPVPASRVCTRGTISSIQVENRPIFDTVTMDEDASFRWVYEWTNRLHVETRRSFLREEILVDEGSCLDPFLLDESGRLLRSYDFLADASVTSEALPDSTYQVRVVTQDEWTTKVDLGLAFEDGLKLEGLELTEENLAGRGILARLFFRERQEKQDLGFQLESPRFLSTRTNAGVSGGQSRIGNFWTQHFSYPFVGEIGRFAFRQEFSFRETLFSYSATSDPSQPQRHVLLPYESQHSEVTGALRIGEPGNLTVFGVGLLREELAFPGYPGRVEVATGGDFSETVIAPPSDAAALSGQIEPTTIFRLNFLLGQRNVRYVQRTGLDTFMGTQDVRLGTEASVTFGRAVGDLGDTGDSEGDDLYVRLYGFLGLDPGNWILHANTNVEGRVLFRDDSQGTTARDILGEVDLYGYWTNPDGGRHTIFARLSGAGGWSVHRPFQVSLGGRAAVRGYREDDFPGGRRVIATVEDRIRVDWPAPDVFDFGFSLFTDVGRVWQGDVPYGRTTPWQASAGGGIRIGFPSGSRTTIRADLAFPLTGPRSIGSPVFRVSLREVLGLRPGFGDEEVTRSRRPAVGTDLLSDEVR